jgi:gamma-glutamylcyclotransferase (GGCT)/AIG2-like uncharacterized protein YtfP
MTYVRGTYIPPDNTKHFIAVYGSLRKGLQNHDLHARAKSSFVGNGETKENFNLYEVNNCYFPSVSLEHAHAGVPVQVEVYETIGDNMKAHYDMLEGYPSFYNRTEILIRMENDDLVKAWIYHIDEEQVTLVENGDWVDFKKPVTVEE